MSTLLLGNCVGCLDNLNYLKGEGDESCKINFKIFAYLSDHVEFEQIKFEGLWKIPSLNFFFKFFKMIFFNELSYFLIDSSLPGIFFFLDLFFSWQLFDKVI